MEMTRSPLLPTGAQPPAIRPNAATQPMAAAMKRLLGPGMPELSVTVAPVELLQPLAGVPEDSRDDTASIPVTLFRTGLAPVEVLANKARAWSGRVLVATKEVFVLPIPRPRLFGKQGFSLALNDAGGITSLSYSNESGVAGAFNALTSASNTEATSAAMLKNEADVIAQTQRLATCKAKPADCK